MGTPREPLHPEVARWLADGGGDVPPDGLLARSLEVTRTIRQRPAAIAWLGGTPSGPALRRGPSVQAVWVLILVLLVALLAVVGVLGGAAHQPSIAIVDSSVRSPFPSTARPSASVPIAPASPATSEPAASSTPSTGPAASPSEPGLRGPGVQLPDLASWRTIRGSNQAGRIVIGSGDMSGIPADQVGVDWETADEPIVINLGQQADAVTVAGHDLASLAASVKSAFPGARLTKRTIGGSPGYLVEVHESSYVFPLASLAVTWHDGMAYVFEEHVIFDGPPSGAFGRILDGVVFN
jgi:hypothetical protein